MGSRMSGKDITTMLRMYERGATPTAIGKEIGRSPSVVSSTLNRMRNQLNSRDLPLETKEKMREIEQQLIDAYEKARAEGEKPMGAMSRLFTLFSPRN
jgi:predicted transcriptional regulator